MKMEESLLRKYATSEALLHVLLSHSRDVAAMAVSICRRHPELGADEEFVRSAAMLHDIGIVRCDAPRIYCFGSEPYIRHGLCGSEILQAEGLPLHARVAERHTGTGITLQSIREQSLPLPERDYSPESIEEQIICFADKFFSKTKLGEQKTVEAALASLWKFGSQTQERFKSWNSLFSIDAL